MMDGVSSVYEKPLAALRLAKMCIRDSSCTGSNTVPISTMSGWTDFSKVLLSVAMIIGMAAGSTSGALKLIRIVTLVKGIYWEVIKILSPEGTVIPRKIGGKTVRDAEIKEMCIRDSYHSN